MSWEHDKQTDVYTFTKKGMPTATLRASMAADCYIARFNNATLFFESSSTAAACSTVERHLENALKEKT